MSNAYIGQDVGSIVVSFVPIYTIPVSALPCCCSSVARGRLPVPRVGRLLIVVRLSSFPSCSVCTPLIDSHCSPRTAISSTQIGGTITVQFPAEFSVNAPTVSVSYAVLFCSVGCLPALRGVCDFLLSRGSGCSFTLRRHHSSLRSPVVPCCCFPAQLVSALNIAALAGGSPSTTDNTDVVLTLASAPALANTQVRGLLCLLLCHLAAVASLLRLHARCVTLLVAIRLRRL
jgi:hypothetical protein